jgi:hypothetical protein
MVSKNDGASGAERGEIVKGQRNTTGQHAEVGGRPVGNDRRVRQAHERVLPNLRGPQRNEVKLSPPLDWSASSGGVPHAQTCCVVYRSFQTPSTRNFFEKGTIYL